MSNPTNQELLNRIEQIEIRNQRVELDKKWEGSWTRKISIIIFTYLIIVLFMWLIDADRPLLNAIVPAIGFTISTFTLPLIKKIWLNKQ